MTERRRIERPPNEITRVGGVDAVRKGDAGVEGRFYEELAPEIACRTPRLLGTGPGFVLIERLPPARPMAQWTPADLMSGARMLALIHGRFWNLAALAEERPWLPVHTKARPIALCHGDYGPGHLHMAEDGTKWVLSWSRCHLGDPVAELRSYARVAAELRPRVSFDALLGAYLDVLRDRLEVDVDPRSFIV